jgi:hypothetical protein
MVEYTPWLVRPTPQGHDSAVGRNVWHAPTGLFSAVPQKARAALLSHPFSGDVITAGLLPSSVHPYYNCTRKEDGDTL